MHSFFLWSVFPFLTYSLNVQSFPYGSISLIDQYFSCAGSVFALWIHSFNDHSFLFRFTPTMISVSLIESLPTFSSEMNFLSCASFSCSGTPAEHHIRCVPRHLPQALWSHRVLSICCRPAAVLCVSLLQLAGLAGHNTKCAAHLYLELYRYIPNDHRHRAEWAVCSTHATAASSGATGAWMRITTDTSHMAHSTFHNPHSTYHMPN